MLTEKEVRGKIEEIKKEYEKVLDKAPATLLVNPSRAMMQHAVIDMLDMLYFVLDEKRPKMKCALADLDNIDGLNGGQDGKDRKK